MPVASDWAALSALCWVPSSEEIASESSLPKLPDPLLAAPLDASGSFQTPAPLIPSIPPCPFEPLAAFQAAGA